MLAAHKLSFLSLSIAPLSAVLMPAWLKQAFKLHHHGLGRLHAAPVRPAGPRTSLRLKEANSEEPNVGVGASASWRGSEEAQRFPDETMRLAEARLLRHALRLAEACPPKL